MSDLYAPPIIAHIPGLQAALDAKAALAGAAFTGAVSISSGTLVASAPAATLQQTWNNAAVTFNAGLTNITDTASAADSLLHDWQVGGASVLKIRKDGALMSTGHFRFCAGSTLVGYFLSTTGMFWLTGSANIDGADGLLLGGGLGTPVGLARNAANVAEINNGTPGSYRDLRLRALLDTNGAQVIGTRGAAVADATDAASAITQLNAFLAIARTHGLIAT